MDSKSKKNEYQTHTFTLFASIKKPKSVLETAINIDRFDEMVRSEEMKNQIEKLRKEKDPKEKERLKLLLTLVCFSGVFSERAKKAILRHSGFICIDIDKIPYVNELKERLKEVDFIHYMFISPSGDGLKIIIKIDATNEEEHLQYFYALENYFKSIGVEIDTSCKDVSRACFLSYDSNPFYNLESETLQKDFIKKYFSIEAEAKDDKKIKKIKSKKKGAIAKETLTKAVEKFLSCEDGTKRATLYKLACYLGYHINAKVLEYTECFDALKGAVLKRIEEQNDIKSKKVAFKTIEDGLIYGIENPKPIDNLKTSKTKYQFWYAYKGIVEIRITSFFTFLNRNGFYGLTYDKSRKIVKVTDNIVSIIDKKDIIEFVMQHLRALPYNVGDDCTKFDIMEKYQRMQSYMLGENQLCTFPLLKKEFLKDDRQTAHLYFTNGVLRITSNGINLINYKDLKGLVWETSVIDRNWDLSKIDTSKYNESDFVKFVRGVTGDRHDKEWSRYQSMITLIGYLLHEYKDPRRTRAIVFCDEEISDNPNGGTGKSIMLKALGHIKKSVTIDGKNFNFGRSFSFQRVDIDTKVLIFEDVVRNFDFEKLFSVITDGITVERKNRQPFRIDHKDAPNILISTNYVIEGEGNSHKRRKIEIEFSQFYNENHTPMDDIGRMLFEDWGEEEWMFFDLFMVQCVNSYLKKGLILPVIKNIPLRKLKQVTSDDFSKYAQTELCKIKMGEERDKRSLFFEFKKLYPTYEEQFAVSQTQFNRWLRSYAEIMNYNCVERVTKNNPLIKFSKRIEKTKL